MPTDWSAGVKVTFVTVCHISAVTSGSSPGWEPSASLPPPRRSGARTFYRCAGGEGACAVGRGVADMRESSLAPFPSAGWRLCRWRGRRAGQRHGAGAVCPRYGRAQLTRRQEPGAAPLPDCSLALVSFVGVFICRTPDPSLPRRPPTCHKGTGSTFQKRWLPSGLLSLFSTSLVFLEGPSAAHAWRALQLTFFLPTQQDNC